jgi:chromosome segregation ATPase
VDNDLGEGEVTVVTQDPAQGLNDDMPGLLRQVGELIVRGQARTDARLDRLEGEVARGQTRTDARLDRLEGDVAELKTDVTELKTDVTELKTDVTELKTDVTEMKTDVTELKTIMAETRERLGRLEHRFDRLELSNERRANHVDAQFERLVALIQRDEIKGSSFKPK